MKRRKYRFGTRTCVECGRAFAPSSSTQKTCSEECHRARRRKTEQAREKPTAATLRSGWALKRCPICKGMFRERIRATHGDEVAHRYCEDCRTLIRNGGDWHARADAAERRRRTAVAKKVAKARLKTAEGRLD